MRPSRYKSDEAWERDKQRSRDNYAKNRELRKANARYYSKNNRAKINQIKRTRSAKLVAAINALKTPCIRCGESDKRCIDFHHKDPQTKSFKLSDIARYNLEDGLLEISKCECLCANCHRKEHIKE